MSPSLLDSARAITPNVTDEVGSAHCELAIAVEPDGATLRTAWTSLRPGGSVYTEWRSAAGGWKAVCRRLEVAGFEEVTCYWVRPDPLRFPARYWLPLDAPHALEYFRRSRRPTANPLRKLGRAARRIQWLVSRRRPLCAVGRRPVTGSSERRASLSPPAGHLAAGAPADLFGRIRAGWSEWGFGPTPQRLSRVVLTGSLDTRGKVVALLFAPGDHVPRVAVKSPRTPESATALAAEARNLTALYMRAGGEVSGVPRLLLRDPKTGAVVETALTGVELRSFLTRRSFRALALLCTGWLADLALRTRVAPARDWRLDLLEPVLRDFESRFRGAVEPASLRQAVDLFERVESLPVVCEQRDFSPWNVRIAEQGGLVVFDWESAELSGFPALDLVYLLTYLSFYLEGAMRSGGYRPFHLDAFQRTLDPTTPTGRVCREALSLYAARTGVALAALRPLRLLTWMLHAQSQHRRLIEGAGSNREANPRNIFLNLWKTELRHGDRFDDAP